VTVAERLLTQGEVEQEIMALSDELAEETRRYADVSELAADHESAYKERHAKAVIHVYEQVGITADAKKLSASERDARIDLLCQDGYATWKVTGARAEASKQALLSLRARLDALRTLAANIRAQT